MLRQMDTDNGSVTKFYPDVWAPKLVLHVDVVKGAHWYHLKRYRGGEVLDFVIYDDGHKLDLTVSGKGANVAKSSGGTKL
jgi:hypothetical protein